MWTVVNFPFVTVLTRLCKVAAGRPINICSGFLRDHLRDFNITVTCLQVLNQMLKHTAVAGFSSPWSFDLGYNVVFKSAECRVGWYLTWNLTYSSVFIVRLSLCSPVFHLSSSPVSSPLSFTSVVFWIRPSSSCPSPSFSLCLSLISHSPSLSLSPSLSFQVLRIMAVFLRLAVLTSARAQTAWCDAATEGCTLCPRAFPRTPRSCESLVHTHTHGLNTKTCTFAFCSNTQTRHMHTNRQKWGYFCRCFLSSNMQSHKQTHKHTRRRHTAAVILMQQFVLCCFRNSQTIECIHTQDHTHMFLISLLGSMGLKWF